MSEHLSDSNILCSRRSYGKTKDYKSLSNSEENVSIPATISEQLKNNGTSLLSNYSEELYSEENFESLTTAMSNFGENIVQKGANANSEINLFNDEDADFYFSASTDSPRVNDSFISSPEAINTSSNYQRTRKNLKSRLSNQNSEETSGSASHKESFNSPFGSESSSNFLNLTKTSSTKQNLLSSVDDQKMDIKKNIKSSNVCVNKLPFNSILFQAGKTSGKETLSQNSSNVTSILDLVNRFTVGGNRASKKTNPCSKRKKIHKSCEPVSVKKASVVKHSDSSIVNSAEKQILNSDISIGNHSKSDLKLPQKASKHHHTPKKGNNECVDNMKGSVGVIKSVNDMNLPTKDNVITPSKAIQKGSNGPIDSSEKFQKDDSNNKVAENFMATEVKCPSSSLPSSDLHLVRNKSAEKMLLDNCDKDTSRLLETFISRTNTDEHIRTISGVDSCLPGPSGSCEETIKFNTDACAIVTDPNSTTIRSRDDCKPRVRDAGVDFYIYLSDKMKKVQEDSLLKCKENNAKMWSEKPKVLALTVSQFFLDGDVRQVFNHYMNKLHGNEQRPVSNLNKGYDFPVNFEEEELMRVVKDFVHTVLSYIFPAKAPRPSFLTFSQIHQAAMQHMSRREFKAIMYMFQKTDQSFKLGYVISKLSIAAFFVIFDEYKNNFMC